MIIVDFTLIVLSVNLPPEAYLEPCEASTTELFAKEVKNC